jgi:hypothetical protein
VVERGVAQEEPGGVTGEEVLDEALEGGDRVLDEQARPRAL